MTVTIELKPETEKRLAQKAEERGLPIETFIEFIIEDRLEESKSDAIEKVRGKKETAEKWIEKLTNWSESHDRTTPLLPDEATRRENIY